MTVIPLLYINAYMYATLVDRPRVSIIGAIRKEMGEQADGRNSKARAIRSRLHLPTVTIPTNLM